MRKLKLLLILLTMQGFSVVCSLATERCYMVESLDIQGARKLSYKQINKLKKRCQNKCLKLEEIKDLHKIITNLYLDNGYITSRVLIPEQNLNSKNLIIKVQEGHVQNVEFSDKKNSVNNILPIAKGKTLNLRDVEQLIDNINSHKSSNVNVSLKPGEKQGSSIIVIDNKDEKKWHITSGIDNSGSRNKGKNQAFNNIDFKNILGLNENYFFGYRSTLDDYSENFMRSYSTNLQMPLGYNNFTLQFNNATYRNFIQTPRNKYSNKGSSKVVKFNIDRVVYRDNASKTTLSSGIGHDNYSNYIADNRIDMATYRVHKFEMGLRHQRRMQASVLGLGLNYTSGANQNYFTNFAKVATPAKNFQKLNYNLLWLKPLPVVIAEKRLKYQLQINGQYSPDMLVISEKDTIGGLSTVRGFKDYVENSDKAIVLRNELILDWPSFETKRANLLFGKLSVFGAFDWGKFSNYEERGTKTGMMTGVAAGIRNANGHINYSATWAMPLEAPVTIKHRSIFYFSFSVDL